MKSRSLLIPVLLYVVGATGDNLLTYWFVVVRRDFYEANPFVAPFIYSHPLYMWFLRDLAALALVIALALGYRKIILTLSPPNRARLFRIASKYWIIVLAASIARILPVIHNLLLIFFGIETPLSKLPLLIAKLLGPSS